MPLTKNILSYFLHLEDLPRVAQIFLSSQGLPGELATTVGDPCTHDTTEICGRGFKPTGTE
jgi:hypothetical protein